VAQPRRHDGATPIPDDFTVTDAMRRWAHRDGYAPTVDIDHATAQFTSHYRSTGDRRKSWPDAWQKWIRDDHQRIRERQDNRTNRTTQQQATTDDQFQRQMARAQARMQQEAS
jgi:hypothetical protein